MCFVIEENQPLPSATRCERRGCAASLVNPHQSHHDQRGAGGPRLGGGPRVLRQVRDQGGSGKVRSYRRIQTNKWFPRSFPEVPREALNVLDLSVSLSFTTADGTGGALLLHNLHIVGGRKRAITPVSGGQRPLVGQQPVSFSSRPGVRVTRSPDWNKMFSRSSALHSSLRERNNQADGEAV